MPAASTPTAANGMMIMRPFQPQTTKEERRSFGTKEPL
ncbi:hypothetical protein WM41_0571 [Corynebacterium simulans]|uniref:Uncharacterized protein n=1 Tax=Corynebacterium simulans TaxID=146827 RepID=A0ABR5VB73_9CORY|nr:hypothetical protein WM41_0571 [Corynebacterium simulans]